MTVGVAQERATQAAATGGNLTLAFLSNVTAGSAIHVFTTCDVSGGGALGNPTDTLSSTYGTPLDSVLDTTDSQRVAHWAASNASGGADTVTGVFTGTPPFRGLWQREISGCTTSPLDGHNGQFQNTPTTTTDATSSGNATNTTQPALISALCVHTNGGASTPAAGTGFTSTTTGWATVANARSEHQRITSTTAIAATFTAGANDAHVTLMAIFDEAAAGGVTIYTRKPLTSPVFNSRVIQ